MLRGAPGMFVFRLCQNVDCVQYCVCDCFCVVFVYVLCMWCVSPACVIIALTGMYYYE